MNTIKGVWSNQSGQWNRVGPPLRPCREDHQLMEYIIHKHLAESRRLSVLVLGVTPEMASLNWPENTDLLAVDKSQEMIDKVWPGYPNPGEGVLCANWLNLPLEKHSRDIAVSDGPFGVLRYPHEYAGVLKQLRSIIKPGGVFIFRIFIRPEEHEKPADVYHSALSGDIGNFHVFKLRLLMAMQPDSSSGVCTGDVWNEWQNNSPDIETLSDNCGWPVEQIKTIDAYHGQKDIYSFPAFEEIRRVLDENNFEILSCKEPSYELGERCLTIACNIQS